MFLQGSLKEQTQLNAEMENHSNILKVTFH